MAAPKLQINKGLAIAATIQAKVDIQHAFSLSGQTKAISFRKGQLRD
jgi:hypothetical protein